MGRFGGVITWIAMVLNTLFLLINVPIAVAPGNLKNYAANLRKMPKKWRCLLPNISLDLLNDVKNYLSERYREIDEAIHYWKMKKNLLIKLGLANSTHIVAKLDEWYGKQAKVAMLINRLRIETQK